MSFLCEHKKNLKKLTKKQLIEQMLILIDMSAQKSLNDENTYNDLFQELLGYKKRLEKSDCMYQDVHNTLQITEKELEITKSALMGAESAIRMYENMSIFDFIRHKFR